MRGDEATRDISRIDQDRKGQDGGGVRIHRDKRMIQKFFSDAAYHGRARALREAQRYRDELLVLYPKPPHGNMFNRRSSRNKSGAVGVHRTRSPKRGRAYEVWQAGYVL